MSLITKNRILHSWGRFSPLKKLVLSSRKKQPIVVLSFPRCGSTWAGAILGSAPKAHYYCEPINRTLKNGNGYPLLSAQTAELASLVEKVFTDLPEVAPQCRPTGESLQIQNIWGGTLVIKEVTLLLCSKYLEFNPKIIFLLRHPLAVVKSFLKHNMLASIGRDAFDSCSFSASLDFSSDLSLAASFYVYFTQHALHSLSLYPDKEFCLFEDLCSAPQKEFSRLFQNCGLDFTEDTARYIDYLGSFDDGAVFSPFRITSEVVKNQNSGFSPEEVRIIRAIWEASTIPWYQDNW